MIAGTSPNYHRRRQRLSQAFGMLCASATALCVLILAGLLGSVLWNGLGAIDWNFLTGFPSRKPEQAGIWFSIVGSLWLIGVTAVLSVPIGVGAAIYLEEYAPASWWRRIVQFNISNLAGVPSIVYGILGLGLFVRALALGESIITGALTLTLVVLPIVILASQEALRAVPNSIRHASYALGATRWQTVRHQVLPAALPGIMTGVILAIARALGEAAPLVAVGTAAMITFAPSSLGDEFTALPLQIFEWASRPQAAFHERSAGAIVILMLMLVLLNLGAICVRYRYGKRISW